MRVRISVVTPTYDRAATLPRLYESLLGQTSHDFEWVVVDDGSSDGTRELVEGWREQAPFETVYRWQPNQGKHAAVNRGVELASGDFCAVMDSDDWYVPQALERMLHHWDEIPADQREGFANVEGLCAHPDGQLVGDRFPAPVFDSTTFEIGVVHGVRGDKIGMYRRDVLADHPFPEDLGWHVTPALVWNRIAARYRTRFVDEVWACKEYLAEGLSDRKPALRLRFPAAFALYWRELAAMPRPMPARERIRAHANYVRYSLWDRVPLAEQLRSSPVWQLTAAAWPLGAGLWLRDRLAVRR